MRVGVVVIFCVTFVLFFLEALLHYNIGKNGGGFHVSLPNGDDLVRISVVLFIFSVLNAYIGSYLIRHFSS